MKPFHSKANKLGAGSPHVAMTTFIRSNKKAANLRASRDIINIIDRTPVQPMRRSSRTGHAALASPATKAGMLGPGLVSPRNPEILGGKSPG